MGTVLRDSSCVAGIEHPPIPSARSEIPLDRDTAADFAVECLEPSSSSESIGKLGDIEILEVIGQGGFGVVLKGFQPELKRLVAVKVLAPQLAVSAPARKRFGREAQATAAILHPNVMPILSVHSTGKLPYLVMPYVACESLQQRIDRTGPLELVDILRIGMQTANGLAAAHAQGLVHRDVKPANILLEIGVERVMLTDFGLARAIDNASITRTGVIAGTPLYMSPEQARGEAIDARSDLFSLGSVLYTLATGRPPFRAESTYGILRRLTDDAPRPLREISPQFPNWFEMIVHKLLAKQPGERFVSAGQVSAAAQESDPVAFMEKVDETLSDNSGEVPAAAAKRNSAPQPANRAAAPADPKVAMLAKLQGAWEVDVQSVNVPREKPPCRVLAEIRDNLMTWSLDPPQPDNDKPPAFLIKLGEPGKPQPVDLVMNPNDGDEAVEMPGIIEMTDDVVRICFDRGEMPRRPDVFVVGKNADIVVLRKKPIMQMTELEGDWHLESATDATGKPREIAPDNWTIRGRQVVFDFSAGGQDVCQIDVDSQAKTIRWFKNGEEVFSPADFVLRGDQLTLHERPQIVKVLRRGHAKLAGTTNHGGKPRVADPKIAILAMLQGQLTVSTTYMKDGKITAGDETTAVGDGLRLQFAAEQGQPPGSFELILGAAGPPQQVDLRPVPRLDAQALEKGVPKELVPYLEAEARKQIPTMPGIIEVHEDGVRICFANPERSNDRPTEFRAGESAILWEFRRAADGVKEEVK